MDDETRDFRNTIRALRLQNAALKEQVESLEVESRRRLQILGELELDVLAMKMRRHAATAEGSPQSCARQRATVINGKQSSLARGPG